MTRIDPRAGFGRPRRQSRRGLQVGIASDASNQVLRCAPYNQLLRDEHDQKERDSERGCDQVCRPQSTRLRRVVLAEVDDLGAEPIWDRRRELADQGADDTCSRTDLQGRKDVRQGRWEAELPQKPPRAPIAKPAAASLAVNSAPFTRTVISLGPTPPGEALPHSAAKMSWRWGIVVSLTTNGHVQPSWIQSHR